MKKQTSKFQMAKIFSSNVTKKYYNNNYLIKGLGMCCSRIKYFGFGGKVGFKRCLGNWGIKREVWANGDFLGVLDEGVLD